ncbi:serine hydrolase [Chitinophaga lutea]
MQKIILFLLMIAAGPLAGQNPGQRLDVAIPALMARDVIPGLSAAWIEDGRIVWRHNYGVMQATDKTPVTDSTLFEAASLTKVVTAYAALQLVDEGKLQLDTPLYRYLGNHYQIGNDPRIEGVTARRVLTHSAGFPNWRGRSDSLLPFVFKPGERFGYSGEGFVFLAAVMEKLTGLPLEEVVRQRVFQPLGMQQSSLVFRPALRAYHAWRHDWTGAPAGLPDYARTNAAASLRTTAADYAVFLAAVVDGKGLSKASHEAMLTPQVTVDSTRPHLAWGLGIGLEYGPDGRYCWHWGDQGDSKALFVADVDRRKGLVYFANSANGLSVAHDLLGIVFGRGQEEILKWVQYAEFDPAVIKLYAAIRQDGATAALDAHRKERSKPIGEDVMNSLGYQLLRGKRVKDAIAVFAQNAADYPASGNVWDSLAEAYMNDGDNAHAIEYYEKALSLDPGNTNSAEQLKKLRKQAF